MNLSQSLKYARLAGYTLILLLAVRATTFASCGDSLVAMAAAASVHQPSNSAHQAPPSASQNGSPSPADGVLPSIVGMWHIRFVVNDQTIQEAYQIWSTGGTEVHNPNVDPRSGNVCLGVWTAVAPRAYKLAHRVWWYDSNGNFQGTIHLSENVALGDRGNSEGGSFALDFYDPNNNFLFEVAGNVVAERISVE
jgi:hypothetical protein